MGSENSTCMAIIGAAPLVQREIPSAGSVARTDLAIYRDPTYLASLTADIPFQETDIRSHENVGEYRNALQQFAFDEILLQKEQVAKQNIIFAEETGIETAYEAYQDKNAIALIRTKKHLLTKFSQDYANLAEKEGAVIAYNNACMRLNHPLASINKDIADTQYLLHLRKSELAQYDAGLTENALRNLVTVNNLDSAKKHLALIDESRQLQKQLDRLSQLKSLEMTQNEKGINRPRIELLKNANGETSFGLN
jgi:hypothetical protein